VGILAKKQNEIIVIENQKKTPEEGDGERGEEYAWSITRGVKRTIASPDGHFSLLLQSAPRRAAHATRKRERQSM